MFNNQTLNRYYKWLHHNNSTMITIMQEEDNQYFRAYLADEHTLNIKSLTLSDTPEVSYTFEDEYDLQPVGPNMAW